jgi:hypothetical protein
MAKIRCTLAGSRKQAPPGSGGNSRMTNRDLLEELATWHKEWREEILWQQELAERYFNMFTVLASEIPEMKRELRGLVEQVKELEDMYKSQEGMEEDIDRGQGTLTGKREVWRKAMEEQEEIDMEVSDDEDVEGMEDDTEEGVVRKGKGKAMEKRTENEENTLA